MKYFLATHLENFLHPYKQVSTFSTIALVLLFSERNIYIRLMWVLFFYIVYDRLYKHNLSTIYKKDEKNIFTVWIGAVWLCASLAVSTFSAINASSVELRSIILTLSIVNGVIYGLLYVSSFIIKSKKIS